LFLLEKNKLTDTSSLQEPERQPGPEHKDIASWKFRAVHEGQKISLGSQDSSSILAPLTHLWNPPSIIWHHRSSYSKTTCLDQ